jgi:hypothetical protein
VQLGGAAGAGCRVEGLRRSWSGLDCCVVQLVLGVAGVQILWQWLLAGAGKECYLLRLAWADDVVGCRQ